MVRLRLGLTAVAGALALGGTAAGGTAADLLLHVKGYATLVDDGAAVVVGVRFACPRNLEVLEANVSVSQDEGRIQGGPDGFGAFCDGSVHTVAARVSDSGSVPFHSGPGVASAHLLVLDPDTGQTQQVQAVEPIKLRCIVETC
jgi:hypothetical protein